METEQIEMDLWNPTSPVEEGEDSDDEGSELPPGWCWATIGDVVHVGTGATPKRGNSRYWEKGTVPWVSSAVAGLDVVSEPSEYVTEDALRETNLTLYPPGTLVVAMYGEGKTRGKCAELAIESTTNQALAALNAAGTAVKIRRWLKAFLDYNYYETRRQASGGVQPNLNLSIIREIRFPFAPLLEQERIVEVIETEFTKLDAAIATLERTQRNLERYRASVLKSAVEGRLVPTEAQLAREEGRDYEHAEVLLERILAERRRRWVEDYAEKYRAKDEAKAKEKGKPWTEEDDLKSLEKHRKKGEVKYKDPEAPDTAGLPELPEGWVWVGPDQIASDEDYALGIGPFGSNLKVSDYKTEGVPLIFVRNIRSGKFGGSEGKFVSEDKAETLRPHWVFPDDVLITKMGDPPGDACLYPQGRPYGVITADCIRLRVASVFQRPEYFTYAIRSHPVRSQILSITKGVAQPKVSLRRFKTLALPLPPPAEQERIVDEIDRLLSVAEEAQETVELNLRRSHRLRQSILKWAFEGKLADQNPSDDPAQNLLERIRAEREEMEAQAKPSRKKRRSSRRKKG